MKKKVFRERQLTEEEIDKIVDTIIPLDTDKLVDAIFLTEEEPKKKKATKKKGK